MGLKAKKILLMLFNKIWETSLVPTQWNVAIVIPILKKGKDPSNFDNYRPISLTSMLTKFMERIVYTRLTWFLEISNSVGSKQAGFRPQRSTNHQVATLSQHIKDALDARNTLTAVFVGFESAYDLILHHRPIDTPLEQTNEFTYLGMTFETKLTWKNQIAKMVERPSNRLKVLKHLAGSLWGSARSTPNTTYKVFVQPIMLHCCETLVTASESTIQSIGNREPPKTAEIHECKNVSANQREKKTKIPQWIPGHCGIRVSESADAPAKKGATILQAIDRPIYFFTMKTSIRREFKTLRSNELKARTKEKRWSVALSNIADWPRMEAVAEFRLRTGHDCLAKHHHRI
nr:hypothetical protein HmN_000322800 [Hymenolepis microstoma]